MRSFLLISKFVSGLGTQRSERSDQGFYDVVANLASISLYLAWLNFVRMLTGPMLCGWSKHAPRFD